MKKLMIALIPLMSFFAACEREMESVEENPVQEGVYPQQEMQESTPTPKGTQN